MKKKNENTEITFEVMEKIQKKEVRMKPKEYFVLASMALGIGTVLSVLASAVAIQAIGFHLQRLEVIMDVPLWFKLLVLVRLFPWPLLFGSLGLVMIGLHLLYKFEFSYRRGFMVIVIGMGSAIVVLSLIIHQIGVDRQLRRQPVLRHIYEVRQLSPEARQQLILRQRVKGVRETNFRVK